MIKLMPIRRWFFILWILFVLCSGCRKQEKTAPPGTVPARSLKEIAHQKGVVDIVPLPGHRLASIGRDRLLIVWHTDSAQALAFKELEALPRRLAWIPGHKTFSVFLQNGLVKQFNGQDLALKKESSLPLKNVSQLSLFLPEQALYLKAGSNVFFFDPLRFLAKRLPIKLNRADGFAVNERQPLLAVFTRNAAQLFDLRNQNRLATVRLAEAEPGSTEQRFIQFLNSERCLAALGENLWLIDWKNRKARLLPKSHLAPITALNVSSTMEMAFSGSMDKSIKVWDLKRLELKASLYGHFFNITQLATIDSLKQLVSASEDGTILLFNLTDFQILKRLGNMEVALRSPWELRIRSLRTARSFKVGENEYNVSEPGTRLLKVNAEIKNRSETDAMFFSSNFFVIDSSGAHSPMVGLENYVALDPEAYFKKKISPGGSIKGVFVFIINRPYKEYRITYETLPPIALEKF